MQIFSQLPFPEKLKCLDSPNTLNLFKHIDKKVGQSAIGHTFELGPFNEALLHSLTCTST